MMSPSKRAGAAKLWTTRAWTSLCAAFLAAFFLVAPIGSAGVALAQDHGAHGAHGGEEHISPGLHGEGLHGEGEHGETTPGAEHEEGGHHGEWDYSKLAWSFINFIVWLVALTYLLRKPMSEFLINRREQVASQLEEARRLKEEAERTYQEYSERLDQLDEERASLLEEMRAAGEAERKRIIEEAEAKAARMRKDAQFLIDERLALRHSPEFDYYCQLIPQCVISMLDEPVFHRLPELRLPTLVLYGEKDQLIPNRMINPTLSTQSVAQNGAAQINDSRLVLIPQCGHFAQWECAEEVAEHLNVFVG